MSKTSLGLAATTALLCTLIPATASAAPGTGCPGGATDFRLWDVSTEPYGADNAADRVGNGDGWVCAMPGKLVVDEDGNPFQLYVFIDNRVGGA